MEFAAELNRLQAEIEPRLRLFLEEKAKEAEAISPLYASLARDGMDFVLNGGKRLRPVLFYFGYLAGGGKDEERIWKAAISIELIHAYLLVHDDIMDQDVQRRGQPTIHVKNSRRFRSAHLGQAAAILIGDLLCSYGFDALISSGFPSASILAATVLLNQILAEVIAGQCLDVFSKARSEKEILQIALLKTARYTVEGPLLLGYALAGGAVERFREEIAGFTSRLGVAFQLQDDLLGLFGSSATTGKSVGSDLRQKKRTVLMIKALKLAAQPDRAYLNHLLSQKAVIGAKEIKRTREIVKLSGALAACEQLIQDYSAQAKQDLERLPLPGRVRRDLSGLVEYLLQREK